VLLVLSQAALRAELQGVNVSRENLLVILQSGATLKAVLGIFQWLLSKQRDVSKFFIGVWASTTIAMRAVQDHRLCYNSDRQP
jgi:hypothetical protein